MDLVGVRIGLPLISIDDSLLDGEAAAAGKLALSFLCMLYFAVRLQNDTMGLVGVTAGPPLTSTSD